MNSNIKSKTPVPAFAGVTLPHDITVSNEEDHTPSRRVTGEVAFDQPLLQSGPAKSSGGDMMPSKTSDGTPKASPRIEIPTTPNGWDDKLLQDIPGLPAFFALEPTAVFVPNAAVASMANRVASVLKERSIEATFGYAQAACTTLEGVEFHIRLYRGPEPRFSHGIIVEVQRREGTSLSFQEDAMAVLYAARNKPRPSSITTGNHLPPVVVSDNEQDVEEEARLQYDLKHSLGALELISKMFQHPGTHRLALETLVTFTDPTKMGSVTARSVSRQLLEPGHGKVFSKILSLVLADHKKGLRVMAVEALGNALQNTSRAASLPQDKLPSVFYQDKLQSILVQDLVRCDTHPRVAYMAARCLEPLVDGHDEQLFQALQKSIAVGNSKYSALAKQATRCMQRL